MLLQTKAPPLTLSLANNSYLRQDQNLADLDNVISARSALGLGSAALAATGDFATAAQGALADTAVQPATLTAGLATKQPLDATLTALAALSGTADTAPYFTGAEPMALTSLTAFGRSVIAAVDAAAAKAILGSIEPPFTDTNPLIKGSADPTKLLRWEVDGFTADATRVMTPPNQDTLLAGQNFLNVFTVNQQINAALNCTRSTNAFGTSSIYTAFVIGDLTGGNADNGGLYAIARHNKSNEPFVALSGFDNGLTRAIYYGGGGWGAPDATHHYFYAAAAYNETNNAGILSFEVFPGLAIAPAKMLVGYEGTTANYTLNVFEDTAVDTYIQIGNSASGFGGSAGMFFGVNAAASRAEIWGGTGLPLVFYADLVEVARFDKDTTAGNTRFMIHDVDNGQPERVSTGIADSGGIGFKLLRIPN